MSRRDRKPSYRKISKERPDPIQDIQALVLELKNLIECQAWPELASHLRLPFVWVMSRPASVLDVIKKGKALLRDAEEIEISLARILESEVVKQVAHFSVRTEITWQERIRNSPRRAVFDVHLGFERVDKAWQYSYLGVTSPVSGASGAMPLAEEIIPPPTVEEPRYFEPPPPDSPPFHIPHSDAPPVPHWTKESGTTVAYLPVLLPVSVLRALKASRRQLTTLSRRPQ